MSETMHERIRNRLELLHLTPEGASKAAGFDRNYLRKMFERPDALPRSQYLVRLAKALDVSPQWLLGGSAESSNTNFISPAKAIRQIPVYGVAAGSLAGQAMMSPEPIEFVTAPPALTTVRDAYALVVSGSSMEPRYFSGDLIFINPHRPVRQGDHVVVQVRKESGANGMNETWVKRYKGENDEEIIAEQYNPKADMRFRRKYVVALHRVLTINELLGV